MAFPQWAVLAAGLAPLLAPAPDEPVKLPGTPAPLIVLAKAGPDGTTLIRRHQFVTEYRDETQTVNVNGQVITRTIKVPVSRQVAVEATYAGLQAFGADGKALDRPTVAARLKDWTPVLLAEDGSKVDPLYLRLVKETSLILVRPPQKP